MTRAHTEPERSFDPLEKVFLEEILAASASAGVAVIIHDRTDDGITVVVDLNTDETKSPDEVSVVFRNESQRGGGYLVEVSDSFGNAEFLGFGSSLSRSRSKNFRAELVQILRSWKE